MPVIRKKPEPKEEDPRAEAFYQAAGRRLRKLREAVGVTQKELAARAGFAVASINAVENGRQRPPLIALLQIYEALQLPLEDPSAQGFRLLIPNWKGGLLGADDATDIDPIVTTLESRVVTLPQAEAARMRGAVLVKAAERIHAQPKRIHAKVKAFPKSKAKAAKAKGRRR